MRVNSADTAPITVEQLAGVLELPLLAPDLTEEQVLAGCDVARSRGLAAVLVRHSDLDAAARRATSAPALAAAIDHPHGSSTTAVKQYAVRDALRRGATEIDTVINTGKLLSRQFQYLEMELLQLAEACHASGAVLKIALQPQFLSEEHKIVACRICKRAGADYIATSDPADVPMLRSYARERIRLKLSGAGSLDSALTAIADGCTRIETAAADVFLEEWKARRAAQTASQDSARAVL